VSCLLDLFMRVDGTRWMMGWRGGADQGVFDAGAGARDGVPVLPNPASPPSHAARNSVGKMQAPDGARPTCRRGMKQAMRMAGSLYRLPRAFMINL
jgi:hypothetical protein